MSVKSMARWEKKGNFCNFFSSISSNGVKNSSDDFSLTFRAKKPKWPLKDRILANHRCLPAYITRGRY